MSDMIKPESGATCNASGLALPTCARRATETRQTYGVTVPVCKSCGHEWDQYVAEETAFRWETLR
jgi:hypothetical protein